MSNQEHSFWYLHLSGILGEKHIFFIAVNNKIKHVFTLSNTDPTLAKERPIKYHEDLKSTIRRLKVKGFYYERVSEELAMKRVLDFGCRDDLVIKALNLIRYYSKGG